MSIPYTPPGFEKSSFNCALCQAFSEHTWNHPNVPSGKGFTTLSHIRMSSCSHCRKQSLWVDGQLVYQKRSPAPLANADLPEDIKADYDEARGILADSPRGSSALLRLAIQTLCKHLGESGENLNSDIAALVKKGLPATVQRALDVVRVIGNNAVHPGQIELTDDVDTATQLFALINIITDYTISQPKQIAALFGGLPESQRKAIEKRDGSS